MLVKNPENCGAKQHIIRVCVTVSMRTRGKVLSMLLVENTEVGKPSVVFEYNQVAIFLEKNRQVGIFTKHLGIHHHFLRDMVEEKDIDIHYIRSEENPYDIITKNALEEDFARHMRRITEGELWGGVG